MRGRKKTSLTNQGFDKAYFCSLRFLEGKELFVRPQIGADARVEVQGEVGERGAKRVQRMPQAVGYLPRCEDLQRAGV